MLLSIIIPAYNVDKYIESTLSMLVSQGLENCEIIVINDGSTDKTGVICRTFSSSFANIHLIEQPNHGVSIARNNGLQHARGDFVYFLDSDDTLTNGTLDFFRQTLDDLSSGFEILAVGYQSFRDKKLVKRYINNRFNDLIINNDEAQKLFLSKKFSCNICSTIYSRNFLVQHALFFTPDLKIGEDVEFILKAFSKVKKLYYKKRICFVYKIRCDSAMQGYKQYSINQFQSFLVILKTIEGLTDKHIYKERNYFLVNSYISNLRYYLFSNYSDKEISHNFCSYKILLKLPTNRISPVTALQLVLRFCPLKFLYKIFKKEY